MASFSTNQTRQLYVVKRYDTGLSVIGDMATGGVANSNSYYVKYKGADTLLKSDTLQNVVSARVVKDSDMRRDLKKYTIALDSSINSGNPVVGQDYITRITLYEWGSLSPENQYYKFGAVRPTSASKYDFYSAMKTSLELNFSREIDTLFTFTLDQATATIVGADNAGLTITAVTPGAAGNGITFAITDVAAGAAACTVTGKAISVALPAAGKTIGHLKTLIAATAGAAALITVTGTDATALVVEDPAIETAGGSDDGLIIQEVEQPWILGRVESRPLNFKIQLDSIIASSVEYDAWGTITDETPTTYVENGKMIADMEYFYMGERGDIYRNVGFPYVISTSYLVDPTKEYSVIDIVYNFVGEGENPQKSQKVLTIAVESDGTYTELNHLLAAIYALDNTQFANLNVTVS